MHSSWSCSQSIINTFLSLDDLSLIYLPWNPSEVFSINVSASKRVVSDEFRFDPFTLWRLVTDVVLGQTQHFAL